MCHTQSLWVASAQSSRGVYCLAYPRQDPDLVRSLGISVDAVEQTQNVATCVPASLRGTWMSSKLYRTEVVYGLIAASSNPSWRVMSFAYALMRVGCHRRT
jgi:hypothetical protein